MGRHGSVQASQIGLASIRDDTLELSGGDFRAVLEVSSVNFGLQGEAEQEATVAGFTAFLNALSFPVQILVRSVPIDLESYLADLERRAAGFPQELSELAHDHAAFLRRLARTRTLLERRFYLVVPAQEGVKPAVRPRLGFLLRRSTRRNSEFAKGASQRRLASRCEEVSTQLGRCGITARRLSSTELARLLYDCWCPELSRVQRIERDLVQYTTLAVRGPRRGLPGESDLQGSSSPASVRDPQHTTRGT